MTSYTSISRFRKVERYDSHCNIMTRYRWWQILFPLMSHLTETRATLGLLIHTMSVMTKEMAALLLARHEQGQQIHWSALSRSLRIFRQWTALTFRMFWRICQCSRGGMWPVYLCKRQWRYAIKCYITYDITYNITCNNICFCIGRILTFSMGTR